MIDEPELLLRLLRRYSPSGHESAAVREFVRAARTLGYRSSVDRSGNGVAVRGRGRPELMFLGHIDTVDGARPVREARGRIHGRGAVDAKGPLASALLAGARWTGPGTYRVVAAVGEETDSRGARGLLAGSPPDAVIAGEPSGWDGVTTGYKGDLRVEATFRGERSHYAGRSPTAGDRAVDWLLELRRTTVGAAGPSPFRSIGAKVVGLDGRFVGDREVARLVVDLRLPPGRTVTEVTAAFPATLRPDRLRRLVAIEPFEAPRTDPVVAALGAAIRAEGGRPTLWHKTGTSDLNLVAPAWGVPGAAYGPGDARLDHTPRESVPVADLVRGTAVLRRALATLLGPGGLPTPRRSAAGA
jgi:[amino group carrier protein]-lysine/ornithine hydrolase